MEPSTQGSGSPEAEIETKIRKNLKKQEKLLKEFQILKKIEKVKELLEQDKKMDGTQQHMGHLQGVVETGKAT